MKISAMLAVSAALVLLGAAVLARAGRKRAELERQAPLIEEQKAKLAARGVLGGMLLGAGIIIAGMAAGLALR